MVQDVVVLVVLTEDVEEFARVDFPRFFRLRVDWRQLHFVIEASEDLSDHLFLSSKDCC